MVIIYGFGNDRNRQWQKRKQIAGNFDHRANVAIWCGAHCPMKHIQGFTRSHLMLPSGKCLGHIAPAAAKVGDFDCKHKSTSKTQLLASIVWYNQHPLKSREFHTPKWTLYSAHQCNKLGNNLRCHDWRGRAQLRFELSNVDRGQTLETLLS